jgi:SAM-dependent methyltransferase
VNTDKEFSGSIPQIYERWLVPLIFEFYAVDLASRVALHRPSRVLEIAAGTGVVTRQLAATLPASVSIVATDLNQPMLDQASAVGTHRPVQWCPADAMHLPFGDRDFDVVVCQFGAMFFPDRQQAFAEALRVLRPGGVFLFNVWDRLDQNEFADTVTEALRVRYPDDPPLFMARVPHGYSDTSVIAADLARSGFGRAPEFTTLMTYSRADSPRIPAVAYCQGTPLRREIEARGSDHLAEATDIAAAAITARFGTGAVSGRIQAHVVVVRSPDPKVLAVA